jgi:hypothetical protein
MSMVVTRSRARATFGILSGHDGPVAEALNLYGSMRPKEPARRWVWPWTTRSERPIVLAAVSLRLFAGCGLAAAMGASGHLPTALGAFLAGFATPVVVARVFQAALISQTQPATAPETPGLVFVAPDGPTSESRVVNLRDPAAVEEEAHGTATG